MDGERNRQRVRRAEQSGGAWGREWSGTPAAGEEELLSDLSRPSRSILLADEARIRRAKALACTLPLTQLDQRKALRGLERYALLELGLVAIEAIIDAWGWQSGATSAEVMETLVGFIRRQAPDAPAEEWEEVAKLVLAALLEPFEAEYGDYSGGFRRLVYRPKSGSLVSEFESRDGTIHLRATNEAINVIVGALDVDVESAQAAAEARLQNLIERGRFADAARSAMDARIRSIQYGEQIRSLIAATSRNLAGVDWEQEVPRLLDEARGHLEQRLAVERGLINSLDEAADQTDAGRTDRRAIATLTRTLRECSTRHMELHEHVIGAKRVFLDEQVRQEFIAPGSVRLFDVQEDLLKPVLALSLSEALPLLAGFFAHASGIRTPRLPRLDQLLDKLFQPPPRRDELGAEILEPEFSEEEDDALTVPSAIWDAAGALLAEVRKPVRLSELVEQARAVEEGDAVADILRLRVLHAFGAELADQGQEGLLQDAPLLLAYDDGRMLEGDAVYSGSDLIVLPAERRHSEQEPGFVEGLVKEAQAA